jgi:hypothetical protein
MCGQAMHYNDRPLYVPCADVAMSCELSFYAHQCLFELRSLFPMFRPHDQHCFLSCRLGLSDTTCIGQL